MAADIEIVQATTQRERRRFLAFPWQIMRHDPLWVPPLLAELEQRVDPERGAWFRHGSAEFFMAMRAGRLVGTICCAVDEERNAFLGLADCIFGFNHFVPDYKVAAALWDYAAAWARARGLEKLFGPYHLDYEDGYGILIEGYDRPPTLLCGHTPPYYREFIERYGFAPGHEQNVALEVTTAAFRDQAGPMAKLHRVAEAVRRRGKIIVRAARWEDWDAEIDRMLPLLHAALGTLPDAVPWRRESLEQLARGMRHFIDPDFVLFAEMDEQVVGCVVGLPNWNEALIHANGLRYPWDRLRVWPWFRRQPECLCVKSILVLPDRWGLGVDALLFHELGKRAVEKGYHWVDLSVTGLENPMTVRLATRLGARIYKRWQVYSKKV
ncbi:MAG: GNAT family N-acetyltransferase [Chloroflexi bacterium]|nr:GNAT family N-acetyltransferase [Chloroflexota bacterium]